MPKPENVVGKGFEKHPERINRKGRPKMPDLKDAIAKILNEEKDGKTALDAILAALRAKAAKGDVRAAQELMDRGYGKSKQSIEHSGLSFENVEIIIKKK
ncbi:MAG: hypothetical protein EOM23_06080 [Candidatus Moranbacteria bacterium]|nr:hypothetical protein [Candidatus Moranbacteria bacterium]